MGSRVYKALCLGRCVAAACANPLWNGLHRVAVTGLKIRIHDEYYRTVKEPKSKNHIISIQDIQP